MDLTSKSIRMGWNSTIPRSLVDLHTMLQVKNASLPRAAARISAGEEANAPILTAASAAVAPIIELMWEQAKLWIDTHPESMGLATGPLNKRDGTLKPADLALVKARLRRCSSMAEICCEMYKLTFPALAYHMDLFSDERTLLTRTKQKRLCEAIDLAREHVSNYLQLAIDVIDPNMVISFVAVPSAVLPRTYWGLQGVLPAVYESEIANLVSADQLEEGARSSVNLMREWASSHIQIFGDVVVELQDGSMDRLSAIDFCFKPGTQNLQINPEFFRRFIRNDFVIKTPRSGCPMLFAKGSSEKDVLTEFTDWGLDLCRKLVWPILFEKPERLPFLL